VEIAEGLPNLPCLQAVGVDLLLLHGCVDVLVRTAINIKLSRDEVGDADEAWDTVAVIFLRSVGSALDVKAQHMQLAARLPGDAHHLSIWDGLEGTFDQFNGCQSRLHSHNANEQRQPEAAQKKP
jgi:hypothetical protein